jgi:hypothetical protein
MKKTVLNSKAPLVVTPLGVNRYFEKKLCVECTGSTPKGDTTSFNA